MLYAFAQGFVRAPLPDIVGPDDVRQEEGVEQPALQGAGQFGPVRQIGVTAGLVAGMGPQAVRDIAHAIHVHGVEEDLLGGGHWACGARTCNLAAHPVTPPG
ncbi:hypothetical protein D3C71_1883320 [compost metagenome]